LTLGARPESIRIHDLASPALPAAVREMMEGAVAMTGAVSLDAEHLLGAAVEQTGLDDFGDDGFREPLAQLLDAIEREAQLSPFGRLSTFAMLLQLAKNRLLVEDVCKRHPEIASVEIRAPIVIAGLQRTGTTHLHNLLSADPQLRHLPYWESLEPVPSPLEPPGPEGRDPRELRTELALAFQEQVMPHFKCMHEMTVDHAHEEIHLLAIDFSTMLFEALFPLPSWRDHYLGRDQTPHYAYLRKVLQVLTWLRGGTRWVLKSPQHMEQLGPLLKTFPDATVVLTHRDPTPVTASVATMVAYGARMHCERIDLPFLGRYWADRTERMLRACLRDRDALPAGRSLDVRFHEYMRDDRAVVRRIYERAGQDLPESSVAAMDDYVAAHPRGRNGRVDYRLSDFGLRAEELRERFRFYVDRFQLEEEAAAP
jgi:hypothetical protein